MTNSAVGIKTPFVSETELRAVNTVTPTKAKTVQLET